MPKWREHNIRFLLNEENKKVYLHLCRRRIAAVCNLYL